MDLQFWIFMALLNASEKHGTDILKWYLSKSPSELDGRQDDLFKKIDEMEEDGFIKKTSYGAVNYSLSEKGKKEAIKLKKKLNFNDYNYLISYFPEMELKDKVETLEAFILGTVSLFLLLKFIELPISSYVVGTNYFILLSIYSIVLFLTSSYLGQNLFMILFYWFNSFERNNLWIYKDWIWKHQTNIAKYLTYLFYVIIIFILYDMNKDNLGPVATAVLLIVLGKNNYIYNKIIHIIQSIIKKH